MAHGFDQAVAPRTPGGAFGPSAGQVYDWAVISSSDEDTEGISHVPTRAPSPVSVLDINYAPTQKKAPSAGFPSAARWSPERGTPDAEDLAAAELLVVDAASAFAATRPSRQAQRFSKSARFKADTLPPSGEGDASGSAPPRQEERSIAEIIRFVRPRMAAPSFGVPGREGRATTVGTRDEEDSREALRVKYEAVDSHIPGPSFQQPRGESAESKLRRHLRKLKQPCPGGYAGVETGLRATRPRSRSVGFGQAERVRREKEIPKPQAATDPQRLMEALAATRPRTRAAAFDPGTRFPASPSDAGGEPPGAVAGWQPLEVNFALTEPRSKGGRWGAPRPGKRARLGVGQANEGTEKAGLVLEVRHDQTAPRHPSWSFPRAPARGRVPRGEQAPPLTELDVGLADRWVRPAGALGTIRFNLQAGRPQQRRYGPHRAEPGSYNVTQALQYLYTHVPGPVFGLMSQRWADGVTGSIVVGGEEALLELSSAVDFVRPSPPSHSFAPLPATRSRRPREPEEASQPPLDVQYTLVKQAIPSVGAWDLQSLRFASKPEKPEYRAEAGLYRPSHALVERAAPGIIFAGPDGLQGRPLVASGEEPPPMGDVLRLFIEGADAYVYRNPAGGVPFDKRPGHEEAALGAVAELTARIGLPSPRIDQATRRRVATVDLRGNGESGRVLTEDDRRDEFQERRGPGMYHRVQLFGSGARTVDFARPQGRPVYDRYAALADGDRLLLEGVEVGTAAVLARAPEAAFPQAERFPEPKVDTGSGLEYEPSLVLTRPAWPTTVDFERQMPRAPFPVQADGGGPLTDYNTADDSALSYVPPRPLAPGVDFSTMLGRRAEEAPVDLRAPLDVGAADRLRFPAPVAAPDFRHGEGHERPTPETEGPLDFTGSVLLPAAVRGGVRFAKQLDRYAQEGSGGAANATYDLDAGCYEPRPHGAAAARSAVPDFARAPARALGGAAGNGDGDRLVLNPKPSVFQERADLPLSEQPFSKFRPVRRQEWLQKQRDGGGGRLTFMTESSQRRADALVHRAVPAADFASTSGRGWLGGLKEAPREAREDSRAWTGREPMLRVSPWVAPESWAPGKADVTQARERRKAAIGRMMARLKRPSAASRTEP